MRWVRGLMRLMGLVGPMRLIGPMGPMGLMGLMGLIGPIGLMGCSGDSGEVEEPLPIALSGTMQGQQQVTRSGDGTPLETITNTFTVFGYKDTGASPYYQEVFPGYRVLWRENTATYGLDWEYVNQQLPGATEQTVKYWDYGAAAYRFMAVTGTNAYRTVDTSGPALKLTFSANAETLAGEDATPYYSHLWYRAINSPDIGKTVKLEFVKPFSKVRFIFTFDNPDDAAITELSSKQFRSTDGNTIKQRGEVIVTYPLMGTEAREALSVSGDAGGLVAFTQDYYSEVSPAEGPVTSPYYGADRAAIGKWYTVLPTPAGQGTFTLDVSVNGEPKTTTVPANYMTWLPGYSYTYIFKVSADGGVVIDDVQSAFTEWENHEADRTIYNW